MNNLSLILVLLLVLTACAGNKAVPSSGSTHTEKHLMPAVEIDSYIDLDKKSKKYSQPVVWVRIASVEDRSMLENMIVEEFKSHDVDPVPGVDVYPAGVKIAREMVVPSFQQSGGDSLLIVSLKPDATLYHMKYDVTLYDDSIDKVWVGHVETELKQTDSANTRIDELMFQATAREIVNTIIGDGLVIENN